MIAYDRVVHVFIWEVMWFMSFSAELIGLVKGLVTKAQSKLHINRLFIDPSI